MSRFTVCSFFSGGGLLDLGFKQYFKIIWANEFNHHAAESYRANLGDHIVVDDILNVDIDSIPEADVFIGGPPCQDYSSAGANRGEIGDKGKLVWRYEEIVRSKKPKVFVMENVVGLARKHKDTLSKLVQSYTKIGYKVHIKENLDAVMFGVAQHRKRVFIVGVRNDMNVSFDFPTGKSAVVTPRNAIGDLPSPDTIKSREKVLGNFPNHTATWTSPTPERILDLIANPKPNQFNGVRRISWDQPSYTITSHIAKDGREFIHPQENRRLTVRECLRLMSVPDTYVIPAQIPLSQQYTLVGNGVAFLVAKALSQSILDCLEVSLNTDVAIEQMTIFQFI